MGTAFYDLLLFVEMLEALCGQKKVQRSGFCEVIFTVCGRGVRLAEVWFEKGARLRSYTSREVVEGGHLSSESIFKLADQRT